MAGYCPPIAKLRKEEIGDRLIISDNSLWLDEGGTDLDRKGQWIIKKNGVEVYSTVFDFLVTNVGLSPNSTCKDIDFPNGIQDLIDFLNNNSIPCVPGDQLSISRKVENNCDRVSQESSQTCDFIVAEPTQTCRILLRGATCPIDYSVTLFDLSGYTNGGNQEYFGDDNSLLVRVGILSGYQDVTLDEATCELVIEILQSDICPPAIPVMVLGPCRIPIVDADGNAVCPDFALHNFNLTPYNGGIDDVFADGAALAAFVDGETFAGWMYDPIKCELYHPNMDNETCPVDTIVIGTIPVVVTNVCEITLVDADGNAIDPCPPSDDDFETFTFDLGNGPESFGKLSALIQGVEITTGITGWVFADCKLTVSTTDACPTLTEIVVAPVATGSLKVCDPGCENPTIISHGMRPDNNGEIAYDHNNGGLTFVNDGVYTGNALTAPTDLLVDFGDGNTQIIAGGVTPTTIAFSSIAHQYAAPGIYIIKLSFVADGLTHAAQAVVDIQDFNDPDNYAYQSRYAYIDGISGSCPSLLVSTIGYTHGATGSNYTGNITYAGGSVLGTDLTGKEDNTTHQLTINNFYTSDFSLLASDTIDYRIECG